LLIENADIGSIFRFPGNPRKNAAAVAPVIASLRAFGFRQPIVVDAERVIVVGDTRFQAAQALGLAQVPVHVALDLTAQQAQAYRIADNKTNEFAIWDTDLLAIQIGELRDADFDLAPMGFTDAELAELLAPPPDPGSGDAIPPVSLAERFGVPPFSVLNAREGWWQDRKRAWIALGIKSEIGRDVNLLRMSATAAGITDPAERARWNATQREQGARRRGVAT
jgi:hypothetical protein